MKFALLLVALTSSVSFAGAGSSGGGSLVVVNGKLEPADLHYVPESDTIPSSYQKMDFKEYPLGLGAFQFALDFLKARSQGQKDFSTWDVEHTEFYFVPTLSGQDLLPVTAGLPEKQVSYTREIVDISGSNKPTRIIIEILKDLFDQLSPEYQALVLTHEFMHHKHYGQHSIISPLIQSLNVLLPLKHRQDAGDRTILTDAEFEASTQLQNILAAVEGSYFTGKTIRGGGGVFLGDIGDTGRVTETGNFIGVTSSIMLVYAGGSIEASGNVVIDSNITLAQGKVDENTFINSQVSVDGGYFATVKGNWLQNCVIDYLNGSSQDNRFVDVQAHEVDIGSGKNEFEHVHTVRTLDVRGTGNKVHDLNQTEDPYKESGGFSQVLLILGSGNQIDHLNLQGAGVLKVSNSAIVNELTLSGRSSLELGNGAQVDHSTVPGSTSWSCEAKIAAGKTVSGQPIACAPR